MRRRQLEEAMDARGSVAGDRVLGAGLMEMDLRRFGLPSRAAAMEDDDGVVELSLALSIGGSSRKAGGTGAILLGRESGAGSSEAEADRHGSGASAHSSSSAPPPLQAYQQGDLADGMDSQRRREMHAMRRQEARKKRHEKQQKKGSACGGRDGAALAATCEEQGFRGSTPPPEGACSADDRVALEPQEKRWRFRDREAREEEARHADRRAGENHELGSDSVPNPELCPSGNANPNACTNPDPSISPNFSSPIPPQFGAHPFPMMAMQYPYPHVQYVPMANGFGFPCMMPCWAPAMSSVAGGPNPASNVFQPVACQPFQPFSPPDVGPTNGTSPFGSKVADLSGDNGRGIKRAPSRTGSLGSNSMSAISDHQSNSPQGGGSSGGDNGSHSSRAPVETSHPQLSPQVSNLVQGQSEHSISSPHVDPEADAVEAASGKKRPSSNSTESGAKGDPNHPAQCPPAKLEGTVSVNKPAPAAGESTPPPPPLPSPLPRMPCVSTTGNGPNGKTITGFLYRYTSTEVSIVCVCHGSSFSPAEFVEHAGGTDIDNPLKHIIVVPS